MTQGKSSTSGASGSGSNRPARPSGASKAGSSRSGGSRSGSKIPTSRPAGRGPAQRPPARRKKNKSIVNQKQRPWGLIISTIAVVVFAAAVVGVVVATRKSSSGFDHVSAGGQTVLKSNSYRQPELPAAAKIRGVTYRVEAQHTHLRGTIKYDTAPPIGGDHSQYWADCTGTVYPDAIANENAVHMLEHGAIWITYNADDVTGSQLTKLESYVKGVNYTAMSPYPGLKSPISLQAWGYQLKVKSASDPRIAQFISALRHNSKITPEFGATCSQPTFKEHPSTFGHPLWVPANGTSGNTGGM
ncbi:DUF3105 domain-containing protein [Jatrophihabitans endophyticus]|uniref:DUF3105 domain-containing protein n=1 Tax=Jatrophihabitans endophyticus TaxID=1206085 RepID=UPI001A09AB13|nr:DUF3105 domain-containing protein [Jatrophihabitans endophyticus]MBE7190346.1 DUF3105 domain-containing protein [Jatrophihabitans endophyticus]